MIKYLESVKKEFGEDTIFICGYEAGTTGFGLYRDLEKSNYSCVIMAPTSLKHSASHKIKNDKVDTRFLAKTLFTNKKNYRLQNEQYWMQALKDGARTYRADWYVPNTEYEKYVGVYAIRMGIANANNYSTDTAYIWIEYEFRNSEDAEELLNDVL